MKPACFVWYMQTKQEGWSIISFHTFSVYSLCVLLPHNHSTLCLALTSPSHFSMLQLFLRTVSGQDNHESTMEWRKWCRKQNSLSKEGLPYTPLYHLSPIIKSLHLWARTMDLHYGHTLKLMFIIHTILFSSFNRFLFLSVKHFWLFGDGLENNKIFPVGLM